MSNTHIPNYLKEIVDTWNRHHAEILRINPDWKGLPVGGSTMFPTINLNPLDLEGVWLSGGSCNDADQACCLIDAFIHHDIPIILVNAAKITPVEYGELKNFRRWLEFHFRVRADK